MVQLTEWRPKKEIVKNSSYGNIEYLNWCEREAFWLQQRGVKTELKSKWKGQRIALFRRN